MNRKDNLKEWFRELPREQVSPEFASKVMKQVMSEWSLNPYKYQPIITKKAWWSIGFIAIVISGILFSLQSTFYNKYNSYPQNLFGVDLTQIFSSLGSFFNKLNNISPAFAIGALAIVALWFFDQLFSKSFRH